jgi:hypothetical protein
VWARNLTAAALVGAALFSSACGSDDSSGSGGGSGKGGSDASGGSAGASGGSGGSAGASGGSGGSSGAAGSSSGGSAGAGGAPSGAGTLIPLYTDPSDASWDVVVAAKTAHPSVPVIAVVNPDSGPGASQDGAYTSGIAKLTGANIAVLGYVATGYTSRDPQTEVEPEIDDWVAWYPGVTGIFFDEQSNVAGDEPYYATLDAYAKGKGLTFTVGNPGTDTAESFVGVLDMMLIYESDGLPSPASLGGWHANYDKKNFGIIPYAVPALDSAFVAQAKLSVGYIYMTDDDLPNPWDSASSYFGALLGELEK